QLGASASSLPAGTWTCTISDANGCSTTQNVTILGPTAPLTVAVTGSTDVLCFGAAEGTATAAGNGGTAPYAFSWDSAPAQLTASATGLLAGAYTVTITDANGCTATDAATIAEPSTPVDAFFDQVVPETCSGANDGSASITLTGGSGSFTISWDTQPVTNGPTATGLAPGLYTVMATDNNGCSLVKQYPVTIIGSSASLLASTNVTDISCFGAQDGSIDLLLTGGQGPYTHVWTDVNGLTSADEDLVGLDAGPYSLHVVDGFGCVKDTTVTIQEPGAMVITGTITTAACQGSSTGAVDADVIGGTAPYVHIWNGPNGFAMNTEDVSGLSAGIYQVSVTDANGCVQTESFNVSQPGSLHVSATPTSFIGGSGVSCAGASDGAIDLDATGGTTPYSFQWSGPNNFVASSEDISNLQGGTYTATVTDANGCAMTLNTTLTSPATLGGIVHTSVFGGNNVSCTGASDGELDAFIFGGTAPYSTAWTGPNGYSSNVEDPTGLMAGTYDVTIVDANGCTSSASATLTEPQPLSSSILTSTSISGDAISCNGASTGSVQLTLAGGTQPYAIEWTGPNGFTANGATITDLFAGSYTANGTDANGCTTTTTVLLTEPASLIAIGTLVDFNGNSVSCNGSSDGSIDLTASGGAGGYSYSWNGPNGFGSTDEDPTSLAAGDYNVLITDLNGCSTTADFTLTAPAVMDPILTAADFNGSNTSCSGTADGSIDLALAGGTAPFTFNWTGPNGFTANSEDIAALDAGTYEVAVQDANGCVSNANITLIPSPVFTLSLQAGAFPGGNQISCAGATDGAIDLTITGGTAPYAVNWSDGIGFSSTDEDINGLGAGLYQVTVTDANGCAQAASIWLTAPTPLDVAAVLSSINGNNVTCNGATDGTIDLTVDGSVGPYSFLWSTGATDEDLSGITAGTYDVTVTDLNGCAATVSYTLTAPATVSIGLSTTLRPGGNNITCAGGNDGDIAATISGGTTPYDIAWTGPNGFTATSASINALAAGTYDLIVTDANGCSEAGTTTLTEPALVAVTLSSITYNGGFNIPCSEVSVGVFDASVTGGTPGYTYAWSGPNGFSSSDQDLTSLTAGDYDLTVTDSNGCTGGATATLTQPGPLDVVIELTDFGGAPVSCAGNDGGILLTVSGGTPAYNFDWTGPSGFGSQQEDLGGLSAGDYSLIVRDANGCSTDTTVTLTAPQPLQASFAGNSNLCADQSAGSIDLTMTGGGAPYAFAWTGPNGYTSTDEDLSGLVNGTYSVTVSDGLGCDNTFSTDLMGPAPITSGTYVSFYGLYNLQCQGDSSGVIELTPQGGSTPFSLLINGPGGYTSAALQNQGLVAGDYLITITDLNGCQLDTTVTLTQPNTSVDANLALSLYPSGTNVSCYGASDGSIDATVSGGTGPYVFNWRGPDSLEFATEDVTGLPAGDYNYELVVTDANQCNFFTTVTLTQPDTALYASSIVTTYAGGFNTTCESASDGAIDLTTHGGNGSYVHLWNGPNGFTSTSEDISGLIGGTYTVDITDLNGCTYQHVVDVVAPEPIAPVLNAFTYPGGSVISCNGLADGSITSTITGGAAPVTYAWTGPNGFTASGADISGLTAGTYCLNVTDANGCTAQQCLELIAPAQLEVSTTTEAADCGTTNGSADLTVLGGSAPYGYAWDNGTIAEDLVDVAPGTYNVTVTDANGCTASSIALVNGSSGVNVDAELNTVDCHGTSEGGVDLTVTNGTLPYSFMWSNGTVEEDLNDVAAGSYSVTITDGSGCVFTNSYTITENTAIAIDTVISVYDGGHNVSSYGASDGSITTAVSGGIAPYIYQWSNGATTESVSGLAAGTYTLLVTDANGCTATLEVTLTESIDVEMPNGFSPNADGSNDTFVVHGIEGYPKNQLTVLNRWGNVVYEQPNYKNEWAGDNSQGEQLPNGTYFIILSLNDGMRTLQGFVDLRR
ncbi:MAG TPA: gliding motility-associated C-terminal domain-containing protein, partial [Flavobacteriales bacterium]|nr:gliding motility-associated C-terminal domain-containing protein [Flavobacteriales bacterium]